MANPRLRKEGLHCFYCYQAVVPPPQPKPGQKAVYPPNMATVEHLERKADGGNNHPHNLVIACRECNSGRGEMRWYEWKELRRPKGYITRKM